MARRSSTARSLRLSSLTVWRSASISVGSAGEDCGAGSAAGVVWLIFDLLWHAGPPRGSANGALADPVSQPRTGLPSDHRGLAGAPPASRGETGPNVQGCPRGPAP